jgi:hypothetical protein
VRFPPYIAGEKGITEMKGNRDPFAIDVFDTDRMDRFDAHWSAESADLEPRNNHHEETVK